MTVFSSSIPNLQIVWDSTSLRSLQHCPYKYKLEILEGWRQIEAVDLEFGGMYQTAVEAFQKARLSGSSKEEAQDLALKTILEISGQYDDEGKWVPWGGAYLDRWRCLGQAGIKCTVCEGKNKKQCEACRGTGYENGLRAYRNEQGNRAKCPWSHAGKWFLGDGPSTCGSCGSPTERGNHWVAYHPTKNRYSLVRLVIWFCEEQDETKGLQPYRFPDGTAAVELNGVIPLGGHAPSGEEYHLAVNIDEIVSFGSENFILDNKSTGRSAGKFYFSQFSPDVQFDTYDMVGAILFPDLNLSGVMVRAAQTMSGGARFQIHTIYKTQEQREEHWRDTQYWIKEAEKHALEDRWPQNKSKCAMCQFNGVCSRPASDREDALEENFVKRPRWNPIERR